MRKQERIAAFVRQQDPGARNEIDPHYAGFFECFNARQYYEAHDVLEDLWLRTLSDDHRFFKGLIQVAGAYVHMQKQFGRPDHPKDGRRLRPAERLLRLAAKNLEPFRPAYMWLDVETLSADCLFTAQEIASQEFRVNPWSPSSAPLLNLSL